MTLSKLEVQFVNGVRDLVSGNKGSAIYLYGILSSTYAETI